MVSGGISGETLPYLCHADRSAGEPSRSTLGPWLVRAAGQSAAGCVSLLQPSLARGPTTIHDIGRKQGFIEQIDLRGYL